MDGFTEALDDLGTRLADLSDDERAQIAVALAATPKAVTALLGPLDQPEIRQVPWTDYFTAIFRAHAAPFARRTQHDATFPLDNAPATPDDTPAPEAIPTPLTAHTPGPDGDADLLQAVYNGYGQISLATLLLACADQAAAPADERTVLDGACEAWFGGGYSMTLIGYRRLVGLDPAPPNITRLRARPTIPTFNDACAGYKSIRVVPCPRSPRW